MQANPFLQDIIERIQKASDLEPEAIQSALTYPPNPDLGDVAFPCFLLAKARKKAPPVIAQELIAEAFQDSSEYIAKAEAAGPYINISYNRGAYAKHILGQAFESGEDYGKSTVGEGKVVAIDYSSPNIAKPFHVGHMRSTIIGGALYRIFETLGYKAVGINHLGDWGTQFGKLIVGLKKWGKDEDLEDVLALNHLYVKYHEEEKENEDLTDQAREWFRKQEAGDSEALELWQKIRDTSLEYFKRIYERLGVQFDSYDGESFFNDKMEEIVEIAEKEGKTEVSDGALIINLESEGIDTPALLKKADGSTLYMTRDLAAALHRKREYDFHKLLYVVGTEQALHFKQLFKCLELIGFNWAEDCQHVGFGRVKGMSTRKGNVVYLEELLDQARDHALKNMRENAERRPDLEDEERVAEVVGLAAIYFSDLSNRRIKDYTFDWTRAISFEGDTGPYLLNAHARIAGIIRKSGIDLPSSLDEVNFDLLTEPAANRLVGLLSRYPEALAQAAKDCEPANIANYLLELARGIHSAYKVLRVKGEEDTLAKTRLLLLNLAKITLKNGLGILGIPALEKM